MNKKIGKKIIAALGVVGPGLFLIGYNIGTGSITTMAKAGAEHGMTLFWAVILSCIFTYILMVAYGHVTLVTGTTALQNIKENLKYGKILAGYILIALIAGELLALMGIMGILADLVHEGITLIYGVHEVNKIIITTVIISLLAIILWFGKYQKFEKILTFFVILMGLCFILVFFMVDPDFSSIVKGIIPSIPDTPGTYQLIAAMVGTTCSAAVFIVRSTVVKEKGWTVKDLKKEKRDAKVSAGMMLFLSGIIMAVSAGTLHLMGLKLTDTVDMIHLFEPIGGKYAAIILIIGIVAAGVSTVFPIILIAPWLISDYYKLPRNIKSPMYRILGMLGLLFGYGLQFMEQRPPAMMIFSQAFQACILPAVTIPVLFLINKKQMMNGNVANSSMNIGIVAVLIFGLISTYFAIIDLI